MATKLDRRRVDTSEDALEAAYWDFDARKKGYNRPQQSERDAFKWAIRTHFPQWFSFLNDD